MLEVCESYQFSHIFSKKEWMKFTIIFYTHQLKSSTQSHLFMKKTPVCLFTSVSGWSNFFIFTWKKKRALSYSKKMDFGGSGCKWVIIRLHPFFHYSETICMCEKGLSGQFHQTATRLSPHNHCTHDTICLVWMKNILVHSIKSLDTTSCSLSDWILCDPTHLHQDLWTI